MLVDANIYGIQYICLYNLRKKTRFGPNVHTSYLLICCVQVITWNNHFRHIRVIEMKEFMSPSAKSFNSILCLFRPLMLYSLVRWTGMISSIQTVNRLPHQTRFNLKMHVFIELVLFVMLPEKRAYNHRVVRPYIRPQKLCRQIYLIDG